MLKWDSKAEEVIIIIWMQSSGLGIFWVFLKIFLSFFYFYMGLILWRDSASIYVYLTIFFLLFTTCHTTVFPFLDSRCVLP